MASLRKSPVGNGIMALGWQGKELSGRVVVRVACACAPQTLHAIFIAGLGIQ